MLAVFDESLLNFFLNASNKLEVWVSLIRLTKAEYVQSVDGLYVMFGIFEACANQNRITLIRNQLNERNKLRKFLNNNQDRKKYQRYSYLWSIVDD